MGADLFSAPKLGENSGVQVSEYKNLVQLIVPDNAQRILLASSYRPVPLILDPFVSFWTKNQLIGSACCSWELTSRSCSCSLHWVLEAGIRGMLLCVQNLQDLAVVSSTEAAGSSHCSSLMLLPITVTDKC